MNVKVPELSWVIGEAQDVYPYGFFGTSAALDDAVEGLTRIVPKLVELAEVEKSIELLADELEKTRRRVNALEYVVIPVSYTHLDVYKRQQSRMPSFPRIRRITGEQGRFAW